MTKRKIGTLEEWLTARKKFLEAEKELTRHSDEVARKRQELPFFTADFLAPFFALLFESPAAPSPALRPLPRSALAAR